MMTNIRKYLGDNRRLLAWWLLALIGLGALLAFRLGSLTGGLSAGEVSASTAPVGWHGIYHQSFYLPLKLVRSVVFVLFTQHGQTLTRLPNVIFGALAIGTFIWLVSLWHSARTAVLTGLLFATGAWTLHVSRLASFDVLYLWATPTLLLTNSLLQRKQRRPLVWYASLCVWGLMLYLPGMVWFVLLSVYLQRQSLWRTWSSLASWPRRLVYVLMALIWLPLLIINLTRQGNLTAWLGLPAHWPALTTLAKHLIGVPVHLFIRGPGYSNLWLGRGPVLDIFCLAACVLGIYFYALHFRAGRSRMLGAWFLIGIILIGIGGPVSLSLLVPVLYLGVAAGIAYLLHDWMHTF
ncbi:MAG TPA: hypothetical protein VIJ68_04295, partial [Candidatus Saccharimonadales bacterium]